MILMLVAYLPLSVPRAYSAFYWPQRHRQWFVDAVAQTIDFEVKGPLDDAAYDSARGDAAVAAQRSTLRMHALTLKGTVC